MAAGKSRKKPDIPNDLVGIAGVHYVAFELSRRKMIALPTTRNTKGYDIVVVSSDTPRHANIQVNPHRGVPTFGQCQNPRTFIRTDMISMSLFAG
jgi:hypothetical protein